MKVPSSDPAMTALRYYEMHSANASRSVFRLSSGKKLNSDDPAGMLIASKLHAKIRELGAIIRNNEEMQDILNVAYGDHSARQDILQRMRELAIGISNGVMTQDEKSVLMTEFSELAKEFGDRTFEQTGMEIVALSTDTLTDELVFKKGQQVYLDGKWTELSDLVIDKEKGTELPSVKTMSLTEHVDAMIKGNLSALGSISAFSSALSYRLDRLYAEEENALATLSRIEDVDMAKEIVEFTKERMLAQVSLAVAAQANAQNNQVLALLDSIPDE